MAGLTLDTGTLIALERRERRAWSFITEARNRKARITVLAGCLAQAWREGTVMIARLLKTCLVEPMTDARARQIGVLLGRASTSDVVDASVVLCASERRDVILTSDTKDIEHLVAVAGVKLKIIHI